MRLLSAVVFALPLMIGAGAAAKRPSGHQHDFNRVRRAAMIQTMKRFQRLSPVVISDRVALKRLPVERGLLWRSLLEDAGNWATLARDKRDRRFAAKLGAWLEDQLALERKQYEVERERRLQVQEVIRYCEQRAGSRSATVLRLRKLRLSWPLVQVIATSFFGKREDPISGSHRFHAGIDLLAKPGTAVRSIADGVVQYSGVKSGYGRLVIVEHAGELSSRYAHLSASDLRPGDRVRGGERIGFSGASGRVTGPHLHFELRRAGEPIDPLSVSGWRTVKD